MNRSIDINMRRTTAHSCAFEHQRQNTLEQIVSFMAQLSVRQRPLPRLARRTEEVATLARRGMLSGQLSPDPGERVSHAVLRLARTGYSRSSHLTPLFDPVWYRGTRGADSSARTNPALHYALRGFGEAFDPSPLFANNWYTHNHPEVVQYALTPILHYRLLGATAGYDPHPIFDTKWYLAQCAEPVPAGMTPLEHFLTHGWKEGKDPGPWFQIGWYLERYAAEGLSDPNPVIDYLTTGAARGRDPCPHFSTEWYREQSPDLTSTELNPLFDFLAFGRAEGREPLPPERQTRGDIGKDDGQSGIATYLPASSASGGAVVRLPTWPRSVLVIADKITATQEISFGQPLAELAHNGEMTLSMVGDDKDWGSAEASQLLDDVQPDLLVLSRYTLPRSGLFIAGARERNIPTVFHIDDDLLDVPVSLGKGKQTYRDPERLAALRYALDNSDLVYTSTAPLAERLRAHGIRAPIVHGDLYCTIEPGSIPARLPSTAPVIGYMGTSGHGEDLALVGPAMETLLDSMPALSFETFGTISPLPQLARFGRRVLHHGAVPNYTGFLEKLCDLGWWVGLAPLADNPFNRCKADTKWVEYAYAGIAAVAQDLPLYHRACASGTGILATSVGEWTDAIAKLVRDLRVREEMVRAAQEKLRTVYSHAALRRQVLDVFKRARALHARNRPLLQARR